MQYVLDLCSGIGGFTLASKSVGGFHTAAFCDSSKYCQNLLQKRFPEVPVFNNIKNVSVKALRHRGIQRIDGITAGLPCPPFSCAGKQLAEEDDRNLFPEFFRILREVRPTWAIVENVPGLLSAKRGEFFRKVLWEIAQCGYGAEWRIISAAEVGAVHLRKRLWIILWKNPNTDGDRCVHWAAYSSNGQIQAEQVWNLEETHKNRQQYELKFRTIRTDVAYSQSWQFSELCGYDINSQTRSNFTSIGSSTEFSYASKQLSQTNERSAIAFLGSGDEAKKMFKPQFCRSNDGISAELDRYLLGHERLNKWIHCATIPLVPKLTAEQTATLSPDELRAYKEARKEYEVIRTQHKERLMGLGNAVVPQCAASCFRRIKFKITEHE